MEGHITLVEDLPASQQQQTTGPTQDGSLDVNTAASETFSEGDIKVGMRFREPFSSVVSEILRDDHPKYGWRICYNVNGDKNKGYHEKHTVLVGRFRRGEILMVPRT